MKIKTPGDIDSLVENFYNIINTSDCHYEALKKISDLSIDTFGDYITPGSFCLKDEIYINLFELLDQIVFELSNDREEKSNIRDYIIEDIYIRLSIILEALVWPERYKKNLKNRPLRYEDTVIIKNLDLSEFVQLLISEQEEWINLEKNIIKTLLYFTDFVHMDYFYNIFLNTKSPFLKAASLLGLKYCQDRGLNWKTLKYSSSGLDSPQLVKYAERFDTVFLSSNRLPSQKEDATFVVLHVEKQAALYKKEEDIMWILGLAERVASLNFENSWLNEINISMCNIFLRLDGSLLKKIFKNEDIVLKAAKFLDYLPRNLFDRLTGMLESLGDNFLFTIERVAQVKSNFFDNYNSNILSFITYKERDLL
ncbi:MAG TPA: hypothetical protein PKZ93_02005 [Spirochaetota bacterium]|nr:hypothetical protein [Spirochaetota bacterium]